jgi:hypothetical protein
MPLHESWKGRDFKPHGTLICLTCVKKVFKIRQLLQQENLSFFFKVGPIINMIFFKFKTATRDPLRSVFWSGGPAINQSSYLFTAGAGSSPASGHSSGDRIPLNGWQ